MSQVPYRLRYAARQHDLRLIICLKTSESSIETISVGSVIEKLAEHGIHCLPCSSTTEVIHFYNNNLKILMMSK